MTIHASKGPVQIIREVLSSPGAACDRQRAVDVAERLGAPLRDKDVRTFLAIAWRLGRTTADASGDANRMLINEGLRQAALFMVGCAGRGADLETYDQPTEKEDVQSDK